MNAHSVSEFGTFVSASASLELCPDTTLVDAIFCAEELQRREFKGLGDTREAARYRVSVKTGVPESYLKRLRHKAGEMVDLPASIYVRLLNAYAQACEATERKAEHLRAIRQIIKAENEAPEGHGGVGR